RCRPTVWREASGARGKASPVAPKWATGAKVPWLDDSGNWLRSYGNENWEFVGEQCVLIARPSAVRVTAASLISSPHRLASRRAQVTVVEIPGIEFGTSEH